MRNLEVGGSKIKKLSAYEKGFIEALVDGEGCINIYFDKRNYGRHKTGKMRVRITIANNNRELLQKAKTILGVGYIIPKGEGYEYRITEGGCRWILPQLELIVKKDDKEKALCLLC